MRITIALPFVNLTGGIRVMLDYANFLHDRGHSVTVVYPAWPYRFEWSRGDQVAEFRRTLKRPVRPDWLPVRCSVRRVPLLRTAFLPPADIVIGTSWPTRAAVSRLAPSRGRKVHVIMHHESGTGPEAAIIRTYRPPAFRITFSEQVRDQLQGEFGCRIDAVVPNGIDPGVFYADGTRTARQTVLMLFHPHARKGCNDGLAALAAVRERHPALRVVAFGPVVPRALPDWVEFTFRPPDAELRRGYSAATAFLYPSRVEGFGLPPLEAMACGCPVVSTRVGAVTEFARHGENAMLADPGDVVTLARHLDTLLSDAGLREQLAGHGLETAGRYTLDRVCPRFEQALGSAS